MTLAVALAVGSGAVAHAAEEPEEPIEPLFNWDLVSLELGNSRFNGSMLTGFHSLRSPGVTPLGGVKTALGLLYVREEQFAEVPGEPSSLFRRNQVYLTPSVNVGFWSGFEAGVALEASYVEGRELVSVPGGGEATREQEALGLSSVDLGVKWNFLDLDRWRLAASFDTQIATNRGDFGMLPADFFNFELDGDFAVTRRFSMVGNLQFITSDADEVRDQFVGDVGATYSFTDKFRGMLFGTLQEDDAAATVLGFVGLAGQYVFEQHSFTLAVDVQLNDANRAIRTEEQIDLALSYVFTF